MTQLRVLIVEDSEDDALLTARALERAGLAPEWERVDTAEQMRAALAAHGWDVILCDYVMPHFSSVEALELARASGLDIPFIIVSGKIGEETAVAAMKAGAHDYVMKSNLARLGPAVEREMKEAAGRRKYRQARVEWRAVLDALREPVFVHDRDFRLVRANLAYAERAGVPVREVAGHLYWELFPKIGGALPGCAQVVREERQDAAEQITLAGGEVFISRSFPVPAPDGALRHFVHVLEDVTELIRANQALHTFNRALRTLSSGNEALIRAESETQLIQEICRILVEAGGYCFAWVGYAERDAARTVRPVARSGDAPGCLEAMDFTWADTGQESDPVGTAIRTRQIQVMQDTTSNPRFGRWRAEAIRLGFGSLLVVPLVTGGQVLGALTICAAERDAFDAEEVKLLNELANDLAFGIVALRMRAEQEESAARLARSMEGTIQAIASTVEMRDPYTAGHQRRVAELAVEMAREMGLPADQVHGIHLAGVVHDLGKIHIPSEILSKPTRLTQVEYEIIKMHSEAGYEILKDIDFPWPIAQAVLQHHERLNGSGYPRGLVEKDILIEARILAVADTVEAMASSRPYRPARGIEAALEEIRAQRGVLYDAAAVDACVRLFEERQFAFTEQQFAVAARYGRGRE